MKRRCRRPWTGGGKNFATRTTGQGILQSTSSPCIEELLEASAQEIDAEERRRLGAEAVEESRLYSTVKGARWVLLSNGRSLSSEYALSLDSILEGHSDLAFCHAMKEEMSRLFGLRDPDEALRGWTKWFQGAKASGIPALVRFARIKEKRLDGLVAHARHNISTGRLEGFNNKVKVAKRVGYGYRNEDFFFTPPRKVSLDPLRQRFIPQKNVKNQRFCIDGLAPIIGIT